MLLADTFIVEMMSLELASYDTSQNQRRNILAIVPQEQSTNTQLKQTVSYDTDNLLFIGLRNRVPGLVYRLWLCRFRWAGGGLLGQQRPGFRRRQPRQSSFAAG